MRVFVWCVLLWLAFGRPDVAVAQTAGNAPLQLSVTAAAQQPGVRGAGLSADDFQRLALERNADLQATRLEIAAARGFLTQARLRPNPGLDVSFMSGRPLGSPGEQAIDVGYAHTFELGGKRERRIDVAEVGIEVAELQVADRERLLRAEIRSRYAEALASARNFSTLGELFELNQRSFSVAAKRVSEGEAAPLEQRLLEVEVGRIAADRFVAAGAAERALLALKVVAAITPTEPVLLSDELTVPPVEISVEQAIARALAERPDVKAARAEEKRAEAEIELTRAERTPDLIGLVRYGHSSTQFDQFGTTPTGRVVPLRDSDHTLTGGVSIPLPFGSRNQGAIETATARRRAALLRREYLEQSVRGEVTGAYAQYNGARQAVDVFNRQVIKQAEQSVATIRTSYELGETPLLDLVQEQRRLVEIQKGFTEALKELYIARATLEQVVGGELR